MKNGFSLVEVIIAITIIAVIGSLTTLIVTRTFRVNSQSTDVSKLKENGQRAINSMAESIRMADKVVCVGNTTTDGVCTGASVERTNKIVIRTLAGKFDKFTFNEPVRSPNSPCPVLQNGYISKQENINPNDTAISEDEDFCNNTFTTPSPVVITDYNSESSVSIRDGKFTRAFGNENKDSIGIYFIVNPSKSLGGAGLSDTAIMQTTVQVR